jgi:CheY-like chemotaxis protein
MSASKCDPTPPGLGTVLIADDNQDDVKLLLRDLRQIGVPHLTHSVPNGDQAVEYLTGCGPYANRDTFPFPILLILDLRMEPGDGFAVLRWLKANSKYHTFPVLVMTALTDRSAMTEAYRLGAATFLTKPFTRDALAAAFRELNVLPGQAE